MHLRLLYRSSARVMQLLGVTRPLFVSFYSSYPFSLQPELSPIVLYSYRSYEVLAASAVFVAVRRVSSVQARYRSGRFVRVSNRFVHSQISPFVRVSFVRSRSFAHRPVRPPVYLSVHAFVLARSALLVVVYAADRTYIRTKVLRHT